MRGSGAPKFSKYTVPREGPKPTTDRCDLCHGLVEFLRAWRHLEASVGSTAPVKERRALNDPKGLLGADFDQIPVFIILDVIVRTTFFGLWAMHHRWD